IPIRRAFQQYANVRPVRLMPGVRCPLAGRKPGDIDFVVVRENNEGEYSSIGGRMYEGTEFEFAVQQSTFTRRGVDRILRYAFEMAKSRPKKHLTSATKSNGISVTMPYWDERFQAMAAQYPEVRTDQYHIDILCAQFVMHPDWFDVVVGSNLFGDILSDLGPGCTGTIAIAPSANLNPEREFPSMFVGPVRSSEPARSWKWYESLAAREELTSSPSARARSAISSEAKAPAASVGPSLPSVEAARRTMLRAARERGTAARNASAISWFRPPFPLPRSVTVVSPPAMRHAGGRSGNPLRAMSSPIPRSASAASRASPVSRDVRTSVA